MRRSSFLLALTLSLAGCSTPAPPPKPAAPPPPPPVAPPITQEWRDRTETPGNWTYARDATGTSARFGLAGPPLFVIRCDLASRLVSLTRPGGTAAAIKVVTSYSATNWPAQTTPGGTIATLNARDPFLDKLAFSRGRFTVAVEGLPELILPAWAEPARVIEDCR